MAAGMLGDDACEPLLLAAAAACTAQSLVQSGFASVGLQQPEQDFKR